MIRNYEKFKGLSKVIVLALVCMVPVALVSAQGWSGGTTQSGSQGAAPAENQLSIAGSIGAINGTTIFVMAEDGTAKTVAIQKDTLVLGRKPATLDSILPGEALGVAATKGPDGSLTATVINVFPAELWQRVRKGQFPMASGQIMTNAQVDRFGDRVEGRVLYLKYDMLTAAIVVPDGAEIHRSVKMNLIDLKPGLKVTVRGVAGLNGSLAASIINLDSMP
jgi:hypothetical protein